MASKVPHAVSFGLHPQISRPKTQTLRVEQGVPVERPMPARVSASEVEAAAEYEPPTSKLLESKSDEATSGQLLFLAWFQESVPESDKEAARFRKVVITYYLEDGSIAIVEPVTTNSGLPQRKVLARHKVPRAAMDPDSSPTLLPGGRHTDFVTWKDLRVGASLLLYGKVYTVYACTPSTRHFYEAKDAEAGGSGELEQMADEAVPEDAFTETKALTMARETGIDSSLYRGRKLSPVKRYMEAARGSTSAVLTRGIKDATAQWRAYGPRESLRFYGLLDETDKPFGDRVKYHVLYYLCDDTMEFIEQRTPNDGRGRFSSLWKRARLPKTVIYQDSRSRDIEADKGYEDYYSLSEIRVGEVINVMGREVLIYSADAKTLDWYKENVGVDMAGSVIDVDEAPAAALVVSPPQYLGFGTEEDSLGSFFSLQSRRPRKNWAKIRAFDGKIFRFNARFAKPASIPDADRTFTVSFFLDTDSIAIFEPPKKNSGILSGKFLAKTRIRNPDTGLYFEPEDFYVGAIVNVRGFLFLLESADKETSKLLVELRGTTGKPGAGASASDTAAAAAGSDAV